MPRHRHLSDDELLSLVERAQADAGLSECETCSTRHAQLLCVVAKVDALHGEADAVFDDRRLTQQRAHILRRLERNHGPARVLPFPAATAGDEDRLGRAGGQGRRWMAAAAVVGLMVGLFSGRLLNPRDGSEFLSQGRTAEARITPVQGDIMPADLRSSGVDELLLGEVEAALARPHPVELRAIDALTPVAR
jgi:hypothetical protein